MGTRTRTTDGFTLIELLVVLIIIGILAALSVPQYLRSVEMSKADNAIATLQAIGAANRRYKINNSTYTAGPPLTTSSNNCSGNGCMSSQAPPSNTDPCNLIACNYLAAQDWDKKPYMYYTIDPATPVGNCGGIPNIIACALRNNLDNPKQPYNKWGYAMDQNGTIVGINGAPPPK